MNDSPVIVRYARSIVNLAIERDKLEGLREDMKIIADTCEESRELRRLLKSPVVNSDKKAKILNLVFAGKIGPVTHTFVGILVRKGREYLLHGVAKAVYEMYKVKKNIMTFQVWSAVPLDESQRAEVVRMSKKLHGGKEIELIETVDPSLIGGVIIRHGDEQWDGSVVRRLHDFKREFSKNPYIAKI